MLPLGCSAIGMLHAAYEGVSYRASSWGQRVDALFSGREQGSVPWLRPVTFAEYLGTYLPYLMVCPSYKANPQNVPRFMEKLMFAEVDSRILEVRSSLARSCEDVISYACSIW